MDERGDISLTFDRSAATWGDQGAFAAEGEGGGEQYLEMIGSQLWVAGMVDLGRFRRLSDFMNLIPSYLVLKDVVMLTRTGDATRLAIPELRVLPEEIVIVGQLDDGKSSGSSDTGAFIEKTVRRLVVITRTLMIDGDVFIQGDGSVMAFVDASDPKFIPMLNVRVRWLADRRLAARFPFALLQRTQILGIATDGIKLGGVETTMRRVEMLKARTKAAPPDVDGLGGEIGSTVPVAEGAAPDAGAPEDSTEA